MSQFQGGVKWFFNRKGYGFLGSGTEADIFVHHSNIIHDGKKFRTLHEGNSVEWDVEIDPSGRPQAVRVKVTAKKLKSTPEIQKVDKTATETPHTT